MFFLRHTQWSVTRAYYFIKKHTYDRAGRTIIVQMPDHSVSGTTYYAYQDTWFDSNGNVTQKQLRQVDQGTPTNIDTWPAYMEYDIANRVVKESKLVTDDTDSYEHRFHVRRQSPHDREETQRRHAQTGRFFLNRQGCRCHVYPIAGGKWHEKIPFRNGDGLRSVISDR